MKIRVRFALVLTLGLLWANVGSAAVSITQFFKHSNPNHTAEIDHSFWERFVAKHVSYDEEQNRFLTDYKKITEVEKKELNHYLMQLQKIKIRDYTRHEQEAYWINLYNALVVRVVLDHYPLWSMRDIELSPEPLVEGPYHAKLVRVEGHALSLDDIYHRILWPISNDPRIHYAMSCGAKGCADLLEEAYLGRRLNAQLELAAKRFINSNRALSFEEGGPVLSSIYDWYMDDFHGTEAGVFKHLEKYLEPEQRDLLKNTHGPISYQFDWGLNGE